MATGIQRHTPGEGTLAMARRLLGAAGIALLLSTACGQAAPVPPALSSSQSSSAASGSGSEAMGLSLSATSAVVSASSTTQAPPPSSSSTGPDSSISASAVASGPPGSSASSTGEPPLPASETAACAGATTGSALDPAVWKAPGAAYQQLSVAVAAPLQAKAAAVYDVTTGTFLYEYNAATHLRVGSLDKLMTALLVMKAGNLARAVTVPDAVIGVPQTDAGLVPGDRLARCILLKALLVRSANDVAVTFAYDLAGGQTAFASEMNTLGTQLGLKNTRFVTPNGLDAQGQYSSAADIALLGAVFLRFPLLQQFASSPSVTMPNGTVYNNVNDFYAYDPQAVGIKTGFTSEAAFCLAAAVGLPGHEYIAVVLGESGWGPADQDAKELLNWAEVIGPSGSPSSAS